MDQKFHEIQNGLQLLNRGYKNINFTNFLSKPSDTNSKGGCSISRTIEKHNESQIKLKELWPSYVQIKEKIAKNKDWKDKTKLNVIIQWKKIYKDAVKNPHL